MAAAAIPFGLGIGLSLGMVGGGGSVLAVPVLVYILGQTVHQATTASLVVVTAGAVIGSLSHARDGRVCWRHAAGFIAAALPGVIAGTALGQAVSGRALIAAFAIIMLAAAAATWRKATRDTTAPKTELSRTTCPALRLARVLTAGLLVGAMTGFFGVGGGFLIVPTLAVALAFSMRMAVGTSLVIITATSLIALSAHLAAGRAGRRASRRIRPQRQLGQGLAALVVVVAAYVLISTARPWRSPRHILTARSPLRYERLRHSQPAAPACRTRATSSDIYDMMSCAPSLSCPRCLVAIGRTAVGPRSRWR